MLPQIPLPQYVLEAFLTVAVSLCRVFRAGAVVVIIMVADELCFVSSGGRLLFASAMPEFIQWRFKWEELLYLLWRAAFFLHTLRPVLAISTRIALCKLTGNGEKGNVAWLLALFHPMGLHLKCLLWQYKVAYVWVGGDSDWQPAEGEGK